MTNANNATTSKTKKRIALVGLATLLSLTVAPVAANAAPTTVNVTNATLTAKKPVVTAKATVKKPVSKAAASQAKANTAVKLATQMSWANRADSYVKKGNAAGKTASKPAYITNKAKAMKLHGADPQRDLYASCDRFVATAVKLSMDPKMPWGPTSTQYNYLMKSPKWQKYHVKSQAKPGDVWVTPKTGTKAGHSIMYLGKQGNRDTIAHASYYHRSAALDWASYISPSMKDTSNRKYTGFRYIGG